LQAEIRDPKSELGALPTFFISPASSWSSIGLKELWEHRELLYFLVWRDVKVRYKQTALGAAWATAHDVKGYQTNAGRLTVSLLLNVNDHADRGSKCLVSDKQSATGSLPTFFIVPRTGWTSIGFVPV
jgi:hypothetical protein